MTETTLKITDKDGNEKLLAMLEQNGVLRPQQVVSLGSGFQLDAFGRLRVSNPETIFDSKKLYDKKPLFWDEVISGGSSTYSQVNAEVTLATTGSGQYVVRATKMHFNYQPAKSQLSFFTGIMEPDTTGTKEIGLVDLDTAAPHNIVNGIYFKGDSDGAMKVCTSKDGVINNAIPQSNWNGDSLDGNGPSGLTIDWSKEHIFAIDYEWLGVGGVRFWIVANNQLILVHQIENFNQLDSVYTSVPNFRIGYILRQTGAGSMSLKDVCSSVISEGGQEALGVKRSAGHTPHAGAVNGASGFAAPSAAWGALMSLRLKSTHKYATINIEKIHVLCTSNANFFVAIALNPTIIGTDNVNWQDVPESAMQVDFSRDNDAILANGFIELGRVIGNTTADSADIDLETPLRIGSKIDGTFDELVLAVTKVGSGGETYYAAINWRELP